MRVKLLHIFCLFIYLLSYPPNETQLAVAVGREVFASNGMLVYQLHRQKSLPNLLTTTTSTTGAAFFFFICNFCFCFSYARIFVRCVCEIRRKDVSFILRSLQFLAISSGSRKLLYTHNSLFVLFIDRPVCRHLSS